MVAFAAADLSPFRLAHARIIGERIQLKMYGIKRYQENNGKIRPAERWEERNRAVDGAFAVCSLNHGTQRPTLVSADALFVACLYAVVVEDCSP